MRNTLVWDLPVRLFHWLFAASILAAFAIAQTIDDDSPRFVVHMLLGGVAAFMVVLRIVWGLIGSRWARFGSFAFGPGAVARYLTGTLRGDRPHHVGHNPGSAWAIFALLALALAMAGSGIAIGNGFGEVAEEVHEALAYTLIAFVALHLGGVAWHGLRHRENLVAGMIDGRKEAPATDGIRQPHALVAVLFLALTAGFGYALVEGFDPVRGQLRVPLLGSTLQLGEAEADEAPATAREATARSHDDEDDD